MRHSNQTVPAPLEHKVSSIAHTALRLRLSALQVARTLTGTNYRLMAEAEQYMSSGTVPFHFTRNHPELADIVWIYIDTVEIQKEFK